MKGLLMAVVCLVGLSASANHHKNHKGHFYNMIEFSTSGFGAYVSKDSFEVDSSGTITDIDVMSTELKVNYARAINHQLWVQLNLGYEKIDTETGGNETTEDSLALGVALIYNFDNDVTNSFYAKVGIGIDNSEDEDDNTEADLLSYGVEVGKRWSLEKITGVKNLSYYASLAYRMGTGDGDVSGTEVDIDANGFLIQPLGIALFF